MNINICSYYGNSASAKNNAKEITIGPLTLYFSYRTIVAFQHYSTGLVCRENAWSTTTGKHLNAIMPNKKSRISEEEFNKKLQPLLDRLVWQENEDQK